MVLILLVTSMFYSMYLVNAQLFSGDGNIRVASEIRFKPNSIHTYILQNAVYCANITLDDGILGLSKSNYAYNIYCSTNDNISISLTSWFYGDSTRFTPNAETETSLDFTVNGRNKGEPRGVSGVTTWSYDEETTTVSLTASNYTEVRILWIDTGTQQIVWYLDRIPMWLGISGMICLVMSPIMFVVFTQKDDYAQACIWMLFLFLLGLGLLIGWLW